MMLSTVAALVFAPPVVAPAISDYWQADFRDAQFTWTVTSANFAELQKINKDFATSQRFKFAEVRMKEPFKLRLESTVEDTKITFVVNGTQKWVRIPRSNLTVKENVAKSPGKRQTILDFGLLAPSLFEGLFQAAYVRNDRALNTPVFDLTYVPALKDKTRQRIWVDPEKHFIIKREWYSQLDSRLQATFTYSEPVKVNGVWFPTKLVVRNADNKIAGQSSYSNPKINEGIAESFFTIK